MNETTRKDAKRDQVADQYIVVAALCKAIGSVHFEMKELIRDGTLPSGVIDVMGTRSAALMELLGNIANEMAIVQSTDAWMNPIFERAHAMFLPEPNAKH